MYIIVDSGSSKSDWVLIDNEKITHYSTIGFNPNFHSSEFIIDEIAKLNELILVQDKIAKIFFYGAGCSNLNANLILEKALYKIFKNAIIKVDTDLKACVLATYNNEPTISCILGTGSNACFYDGENVIQQTPALGYILGDEGSGTYFGKKLIKNYLYHLLPQELEDEFNLEFDFNKDKIIDKIYKQANANVFLASFIPFILKNKNHEFIKQMLFEGFEKFIKIHIYSYPNYKNLEINFIGSLAYFFREELIETAKKFELNINQVIQKPIEGLIKYHQKIESQKNN